MFFRQVIGQHRIKQQLIKAVEEGRVSHAQMFLGPDGSGNLPMALAFAQYINCEDRQTVAGENGELSSDSCGKCPSCVKAHKIIHPDIHYTFPFVKIDDKELSADWMYEWREFIHQTPYGSYNDWIEKITEGNKQGNITAKECQEILRKLSLKNYESTYKVQILWMPEFLDKEGNRLLKILEEPPDNTVFLLVATDSERILNTIMSRVQIVKFPRLGDEEVAQVLEREHQLSEDQALKVAKLAGGDLQEAIRLLDIHEDANTAMIREWMEACYRQQVKQLFAWNERFLKMGREQQKMFFQYCMHFFREVMLLQAGAGQLAKLTEAELKTAQGLGQLLGVERLMHIIELFDKSIYFVERNVNGKIMMTFISVTLLKQFQKNYQPTRPFYDRWAL